MLRHGLRIAAALLPMLGGLAGPVSAQPPGATAPPPAVVVAPVAVENVAPSSSFVGHVQAIQSVAIVPRVTAFIEQEPVKQGSDVKKGEVLFELQKAQYQAAVEQAQAQLDSANAALKNAQLQYQRAAQLAHQGFEAQSNLDQAIATRDQDQANVLAAQASLAEAALNLSYCTIVAPIDGRIGAIAPTVGNLVTPSTPAMVTINQMDPIRVVFPVSDRQIVSVQQQTGASVDKIAAGLAVTLTLPDGKPYAQAGRIAFLGNEVSTETGTVSVYADFPNPDRLLLPGSYVTVNVRRAQPQERPVVPVASVITDQQGSYVLVVDSNDVVQQQPITLGWQVAQNYIVEKGLTGGERVIVAGMQKVRPGERVAPQLARPQATAQTGPGAAGGGEGG
ncbi:MAG TPA: efflux RND transporter periplasmic adaptor subunit [Acetobacteraceae bacterium]|nr:efflux RND transporter periplasmic adaptor subunit [Acetobacteraceae bacterium]